MRSRHRRRLSASVMTATDYNQIPEGRDGVGDPERAKEKLDELLVRLVILATVVVDLEIVQVAAHLALFDT
jgi:hypothetical protein